MRVCGSSASAARLHSFSVLMHWAGSRRAVEVAEALGADELAEKARAVEKRAAELLETRCWNDDVGALTQVAGEPQLDAALLLAVHLGYLTPEDPRASSHVDAIRSALSVDGGLLRRYTSADDFGTPRAAFTVCTFWLVEALASSAERTKPGSSSSTCSRSTTASGSTPRTSSRTPWSRAATSRRRTATSA